MAPGRGGGEGARQPRASAGTRSSPQAPPAAQPAQHHACPLWTPGMGAAGLGWPLPCAPAPAPPAAGGCGRDAQTLRRPWGSGWIGPGAQDGSAGAGGARGSGSIPGARRCPLAQRLPAGDPSSPARPCPRGRARGESQQGWGRVGRGLSVGPGSQLHPAQLSPLLRTVMLLWFGFTLGQPRGVPARYICGRPPAPSPCRAHRSGAHHGGEVGTARGLPGGACSGALGTRGSREGAAPGGHGSPCLGGTRRGEGRAVTSAADPVRGLSPHCAAPPPA